MTNWRKKFPKPHPDAVWCDECLRWETGGGRFERVYQPLAVRAVRAVARAIGAVAVYVCGIGDRLQVRENIKRGVFDERS